MLDQHFLDSAGLSVIEFKHVQVGHSGIPTIGFARWPTHQFDRLVTDRFGQLANETELHHWA